MVDFKVESMAIICLLMNEGLNKIWKEINVATNGGKLLECLFLDKKRVKNKIFVTYNLLV